MHTSAGPAPRWSGLETRPGHGIPAADDPVPSWSRSRPYPARLKTNRRLSAAASAKDVRHFEIDLGESGIRYEPGDALGVWPAQCPALVDRVLAVLGCDGEEAVPGRDGETVSLRLALTRHYELGRLTPALLGYAAERAPDPELLRAASPAANGERQSYLEGRDVLDLLEAHPTVRPAPGEFVALLRKLQPRLYSISSSPRAHPNEVHLTVGAVRYTVRERERKGMASCFLADRAEPDTPVPVYLHANPAFRPPGPEVPLILIGPGTGIAPFRAFLQDREALGARGRSWLFFGDQRESTDFLYREELEAFLKSGRLNRLDLAWSRDAAAKVYVQHRMREAAAELWRWLEDGAAVYVCGDASRMARDVDAALHEVIQLGGGRTADQAREYVAALQSRKRYQRDVY